MNMYTVVFGIAYTLEAEDEDAAVDAAHEMMTEELGLVINSYDRFFVDAIELEEID